VVMVIVQVPGLNVVVVTLMDQLVVKLVHVLKLMNIILNARHKFKIFKRIKLDVKNKILSYYIHVINFQLL